MLRVRHRRTSTSWLLCLLASAVLQGSAVATYAITRPVPAPVLTITVVGDGSVLVTLEGDAAPRLRCSARCSVALPRNRAFVMEAVLGTDATFRGFAQRPMAPPSELVPLLGDALAPCRAFSNETVRAEHDPLRCRTQLVADTDIEVRFGAIPKQVDVAFVPDPALDTVEPTPSEPPKAPPKRPVPKPIEVALVPPQQLPPPRPLPPPPPPVVAPPPPPPVAPPPPPPPDKVNMTAVEVPDENLVDKAPDDATHISDKNRDVTEEQRAKDTNLDKAINGTAVASIESPDRSSAEIGGPEGNIRQTEEVKAPESAIKTESDHSGDAKAATGGQSGAGGDGGENGTGGLRTPGVLSMRGIAGRGALADQANGDGKKVGKAGLPGLNSQLAFNDYERIVGKDRADAERELAAKKLAAKKGRYEKKLEAMRSALENFTPDVRPGNQTALKTRAHPFGVYLARMHRRIHELWGFGFLEDLDDKGAGHPLNDFGLVTVVEVVINPDGTVFKATIAKTSRKLEFDVAAVDAILSSGPYEATPEVIRSVDQRVYLRWGFHRDWRQCGTFNAEPYILTDIPGGVVPLETPAAATSRNANAIAREGATDLQTPSRGTDAAAPTTNVKDKNAIFAANRVVAAWSNALVAKLLEATVVPLRDGDKLLDAAAVRELFTQRLVDAGPMRTWKLYTAGEYGALTKATPPSADTVVLVITGASASTALLLTAASGYKIAAIAR